VSLRLRSELRLRLGPRHCDAAISRAGFGQRAAGRAHISGANGESLGLALEALVSQGHELPSRAALCVEDEYLYTLLLPAVGAWGEAEAAARAQFAQMLGDDRLCVQMTLAPCATRWIAMALETARLEEWRETLGSHGIALLHVRPALLEDLAALHGDLCDALPSGEGLAVLVRDEGASLVGLNRQRPQGRAAPSPPPAGVEQSGKATFAQQTIAHLEWERCDVGDARQLGARIEANCLQHAAESEALPAVCVVPLRGGQRLLLEDLCHDRGWKLGRPLDVILNTS
jgi:hypothetical protein